QENGDARRHTRGHLSPPPGLRGEPAAGTPGDRCGSQFDPLPRRFCEGNNAPLRSAPPPARDSLACAAYLFDARAELAVSPFNGALLCYVFSLGNFRVLAWCFFTDLYDVYIISIGTCFSWLLSREPKTLLARLRSRQRHRHTWDPAEGRPTALMATRELGRK